jgi:hypothetical protein
MSTVTVLYKRANDIRFDIKDKNGKEISLVVKGANAKIRNEDGTVIPSSALPYGEMAYGITPNVDAEVWAEVEKVYGSMSIFKLGIIKATTPKTEKTAKEEIVEVEKTDDPIEQTSEDVEKPKRRTKKK